MKIEYIVLIGVSIALAVALFFITKAFLKARKRNKKYAEDFKPIIDIDAELKKRETELTKIKSDSAELSTKYTNARELLEELEKELKIYQDDIELIEFGVYEPHFDFETSEEYKARLVENKDKQKELIKEGLAAVCNTTWSVGDSAKKGEMMIKRATKLTLRAFNGECDSFVAKVKWNNIDQSEQRIHKVFTAINKLNKTNDIHIKDEYLNLKIEELRLAHELQQKKYEEKEEQRRIREQMREEEKAQAEIEKAKKEAEEEEKRYEKALKQAEEELKGAKGAELEKLNSQLEKLQQELKDVQEAKERAISRAQLTKSGHVYIISNIGSFGEKVYKIGMTRRLEPLDRVKELGDASVPFRFDVHAMIYSENAPELEHNLHKTFNDKRVNMINTRKEYFNVTLKEIEEVVKDNHEEDIEFTLAAEAQEYRETLALLKKLTNEEVKEEEPTAASKYPESIL